MSLISFFTLLAVPTLVAAAVIAGAVYEHHVTTARPRPSTPPMPAADRWATRSSRLPA